MAKNRKSTIPVLIDIKFNGSMNKFEETYGDHISYAEVEQESYIDLKSMIFEKINSSIKIRKFNREKNVLTLKADMLDKEFQLLQDILANKVINESATKNKKTNPEGIEIKERFNFLHNFIISNVKIMTNEDLIKLKKSIPLSEDDDEVKTEESEIIEVSLDEAEDLSDEDFD